MFFQHTQWELFIELKISPSELSSNMAMPQAIVHRSFSPSQTDIGQHRQYFAIFDGAVRELAKLDIHVWGQPHAECVLNDVGVTSTN